MENGTCRDPELNRLFCDHLRKCMDTVFTGERPNNAHWKLVSSFQVAMAVGVPIETLASTLLDQLPDTERGQAVKRLAEEFNVPESRVEELLHTND